MPRALKGFNDMLPGAPGAAAFLDSRLWECILRVSAEVLAAWGYLPTYLPIAEETALFARGLGESSDVVSKEMYSFVDRGGRPMTLRPEGTAGAVRAFVEHQVGRTDPPHRWYYSGPMFRAERPQKGRYRQFYQLGAECFGVDSALADIEMLQMLHELTAAWGLEQVEIQINTLGDGPSRVAYRQALQAHFRAAQDALCAACQTRLENNVLRLLDCKNPNCQQVVAAAPDIADSLSPAAAQRFAATQKHLDALALPVVRRPHLVRGLDYYTGLIFEFVERAPADGAAGLGAQSTVLGGGRYDGLCEDLGGPPTPAVGFSVGLERLALLLAAQQNAAAHAGADLLILPLDEASGLQALQLAPPLRQAGLRVEVDLRCATGKLAHQLRRADRLGHRFGLVLGEAERLSGQAQLKDLRQRSAQPVELRPEALLAALRAVG